MKVLIELPTWLGDTVMVTPAIENLISNYSEPDITLIGTKPSIELLKNLKHVNKTQHIEKSYLSIYKISKKLGEFDIFFHLENLFDQNILNIKFVVKINSNSKEADMRIFTKLKSTSRTHEYDEYSTPVL